MARKAPHQAACLNPMQVELKYMGVSFQELHVVEFQKTAFLLQYWVVAGHRLQIASCFAVAGHQLQITCSENETQEAEDFHWSASFDQD